MESTLFWSMNSACTTGCGVRRGGEKRGGRKKGEEVPWKEGEEKRNKGIKEDGRRRERGMWKGYVRREWREINGWGRNKVHVGQ